MSETVIALLALGLAALSAFLSVCEASLARGAVPERGPSRDTLEPPTAPPAAALDRCEAAIVSTRARCRCGDPLEVHPAGACDGCDCGRFDYAGGLVAKAG